MSNLLMFISGFIVIGNFQEIPPPDLESLCESKTQSCAECLQTPECMWCKDPVRKYENKVLLLFQTQSSNLINLIPSECQHKETMCSNKVGKWQLVSGI